MCGKFTQLRSWQKLLSALGLAPPEPDDAVIAVTPMRTAQIMRLDAEGRREMVPMRWGFADRLAKSPLERPRHMHVRAETIDSKPTFAAAFAKARGILPVHSFNEGEELPNGKTKQWTITPNDGRPIAIAVLWEEWVDGDNRLLTFVMATTPPNALIGKITTRMPAILAPEQWAKWLGEEPASLHELKALLVPFEGDWEMREQVRPAKPRPPGFL